MGQASEAGLERSENSYLNGLGMAVGVFFRHFLLAFQAQLNLVGLRMFHDLQGVFVRHIVKVHSGTQDLVPCVMRRIKPRPLLPHLNYYTRYTVPFRYNIYQV